MPYRMAMFLAVLVLFVPMLAAGATEVAQAAPAAPGQIVARGFRPGGPMAWAGASVRGQRRTTNLSLNWSGYAVTGGRGAFRSVSAKWVMPTVTCNSGSPKYASFWAGLDGYANQTVEQIGADADCSGNSPRYYGWYEMFPAFPVLFTATVRPGDRMSASVTFSGRSTYTLVLRDLTRGWTRTVTQHRTGPQRASAEVITEAPSSAGGILPLANFRQVSYSSSAANGTSLGTRNPIRIIMINGKGQPKDAVGAISRSGGFSITWLRST